MQKLRQSVRLIDEAGSLAARVPMDVLVLGGHGTRYRSIIELTAHMAGSRLADRLRHSDRLVIADELKDIAFRVVHVQGAPTTPVMLEGGDFHT